MKLIEICNLLIQLLDTNKQERDRQVAALDIEKNKLDFDQMSLRISEIKPVLRDFISTQVQTDDKIDNSAPLTTNISNEELSQLHSDMD